MLEKAGPPEGRGYALRQRGVRSGLRSRHHGSRGEAVQGSGVGPVESAPDTPVLMQQQRSKDRHCPAYLGDEQPVHEDLDTCMHQGHSKGFYCQGVVTTSDLIASRSDGV